ncbi:hypothetical protein [Abyssisolibacter fermentans]|uniref:hypothetical protein n=1 Tax=Abyssisolibacter fermentans TaxID=1766203 RepID=UPI00082F5E07|nr:hypothetical protein [Abyssisolibacter fermentans]
MKQKKIQQKGVEFCKHLISKLHEMIDNDVFGPIMLTGSSLHTAVLCGLGYMALSFAKLSNIIYSTTGYASSLLLVLVIIKDIKKQ